MKKNVLRSPYSWQLVILLTLGLSSFIAEGQGLTSRTGEEPDAVKEKYCEGLTLYNRKRDKEALLNIFKENWHWLVADEISSSFSPEKFLNQVKDVYEIEASNKPSERIGSYEWLQSQLAQQYEKERFSPKGLKKYPAITSKVTLLHAKEPRNPKDDTKLTVYCRQGVPVGFVSYYMEDKDTGIIRNMSVLSNLRNYEGINYDLLDHAIKDLKAQGAKVIEITVRAQDERILSFPLLSHFGFAASSPFIRGKYITFRLEVGQPEGESSSSWGESEEEFPDYLAKLVYQASQYE
jgi:predicted GNAT family acetyltransferase